MREALRSCICPEKSRSVRSCKGPESVFERLRKGSEKGSEEVSGRSSEGARRFSHIWWKISPCGENLWNCLILHFVRKFQSKTSPNFLYDQSAPDVALSPRVFCSFCAAHFVRLILRFSGSIFVSPFLRILHILPYSGALFRVVSFGVASRDKCLLAFSCIALRIYLMIV